ncbi:ArsR/SmtB family transcription factor [Tautonia sociabilis]|uniref:Transcriptional regulator n=1 Tax=Tautonia sociabilis TaxID=2080755 RepID=A0A432MFS3_9BACT|nr:metalloregulator ArsR/SmtB family transcription factor [Tautonia sociabilis]RUL85275.1 transcriptional regulator [Tautonia sociabilis]
MDATAPPTSLAESTALIRAFADPVRLRLLNLLAGGREVCVCHLHEALALPQPTVSRHLASLRKLGLVVARKDGLWVHYRLAPPRSDLHRTLIEGVGGCLAAVELLREDRRRLDRLVSSCDPRPGAPPSAGA